MWSGGPPARSMARCLCSVSLFVPPGRVALSVRQERSRDLKGVRDAMASVVGVGTELTPHLERRMEDRDFTEIDLRTMLARAQHYRPDIVEGRCIIETRHRRRRWEVIVEPDPTVQRLVVVTAYPVER